MILQLLVVVVEYLIPCFYSYLALQRKDKEEINSMLQYWLSVVVLDFFFFLFEAFLQRIVIGYSFLKFCFFVAFSHPTFKLYSIFYSKVTSMVVIPNKEKVQQWIDYGKKMIKKVLDKVEENAKQTKTTKTEETIQ